MPQMVPPPPDTPSILASNVDNEAEMIADSLMGGGSPQQPQAAPSQPQQADIEADAIATQLMGIQDMSMPPPKAAVQAQAKSGQAPAPKPMQRATITRKSAGQQLHPPPPPRTVPDQWGGIAALTHAGRQPNAVAQAMNEVAGIPLNIARSIPVIGQHVDPMIQQNAQANRELTQNPIAGNAATLMNIPRGFLGVFEDLGNAAVNTAARALPFSTLQAMGINALPDAPFKTREHWDQLTGQNSAKLRQQLPATAATGEMAGASMVPMTPHAAKGAPVSIRKGFVHGAAGGQALGMVSSAGAQAKEGPVDYGRAFKEGLPAAAMGAGLGMGGAAISKGFGRAAKNAKTPKPSAEKPATLAANEKPSDILTMADGSQFSPVQAIEQIKDPATPPAVKQELNALLDAHESEFVGKPKQEQPKPQEPALTIEEPVQEPVVETSPTQEALPPESEAPTPEPAAPEGELPTPAAESPAKPKGFFGNRRKYNQGATGDDVYVTFPTEAERDLVSYATKPSNFTVEQRNALAERLGVPPDEFHQYAKNYAENVKQLAKAGRRENPEMMAPTREPYQAPEPPPSDNYTPTAPDGYEAPAPKPTGDRFTVQKNTEKKGGYVDIIDSSTGEVISSSKRTEAQAAALAAKYNDLAVNAPDKLEPELRRGSKNFLDFRKTTDPVRNEIVEAGQDLPEGHALSEPLKAVATAKQAFDYARAKFESAVDAFYKLTGEKQGVTMKRERRFNKEVEALVEDAQASGGKDLTVEINNSERVEPVETPRFQRGMKPEEAFKVVEDLHADMKAKEKAYQASRKEVEQPFLESDLGQSVNIRTEDGKVNIRAVPKQGTELNAKAEEIRGPVPSQEKADRSFAKVQKVANKKGIKTRRNQRGSVRVVVGKKNAPPAEKLDATESMFADLLKGAKEIGRDVANSTKDFGVALRRMATLKNTGDIVEQMANRFGTDLKSEWDQFFGRLGKAGQGIKFETGDAGLLEAALQLEPWTLREGGQAEVVTADGVTKQVDLSKFSPEQLWYLSQTKAARSRLADAIQETLDLIESELPYDQRDQNLHDDISTLRHLQDGLRGVHAKSGTSENRIFKWISGAVNDYLFRWNPRFHLLNMTDLPITGSLRLGLHRLSAAVETITTDKTVRDFLAGIQSKSAVDEVRQDWARETLDTEGNRSNSLLAKVRRTADIPTDQMNFLASFAGGAIERGEQIGYKGLQGLDAGKQYLKDFASGKLSKEEEILAYSHALQAAHDVTGTGMQGLNKDVVQRSGMWAKAVTLFTSQPLRVARLVVNKTIKGIRTGEITPQEGAVRLASFVAAQVFFGGEAIIPREVDKLEELFPQIKPAVQAVRDAANFVQLSKYVPGVGRDLTEKLRVSLVPVLGNIRGNIAAEKLGKTWEQVLKLDPKAAPSITMMALSGILRGGGTAIEQAAKNFSAAAKGDKTFYAFEGVGSHPKKTTFKKLEKRNYNMGDALADTFLPGERPSVGEWKKQQREAAINKTARKRGINFKK